MLPVQPATHDHLEVPTIHLVPLQYAPQILRAVTRVQEDYIYESLARYLFVS